LGWVDRVMPAVAHDAPQDTELASVIGTPDSSHYLTR
jgi:hypothetical protein